MIREIKSYFWGQGDKPIKRDDHCMDELRYYIMSKPHNQQKTNESIFDKHIKKLTNRKKEKRFC